MGQVNKERILQEDAELAWLGMDFTRAEFIDVKPTPSELKNEYIPRWNGLLVLEWYKFDIEEYFAPNNVKVRFKKTLERNWEIDTSDLKKGSDDAVKKLTWNDVEEIASAYEGYTDKALGLLFVVERFDKDRNFAVIWVSFLDLQEGDLIVTGRMTGKPGGGGVVEYWGEAVFEVIELTPHELDDWIEDL